MMQQTRESHRSLLGTIFIGITVLVFTILYMRHAANDAAQGIAAAQLQVQHLRQQLDTQQRVIALEPKVNAALSKATEPLTPGRLVKEHEDVSTCAGHFGLVLAKYNVTAASAGLLINVTGDQNRTLQFLDCLDRVELPISPSTFTFTANDNKTVTTSINGLLVHA